MSRVGKQPIEITNGVTVENTNNLITVKGPKGELKKQLNQDMIIEIADNQILVKRPNDSKSNKAFHGLTRSLIANMVEGVSKGFEKRLEIVGVGYRAKTAKNKITLSKVFKFFSEKILKNIFSILLVISLLYNSPRPKNIPNTFFLSFFLYHYVK